MLTLSLGLNGAVALAAARAYAVYVLVPERLYIGINFFAALFASLLYNALIRTGRFSYYVTYIVMLAELCGAAGACRQG